METKSKNNEVSTEKDPAQDHSKGQDTKDITLRQAEEVIRAIEAIDGGPQVLKLYMEMCARCGTCAAQCPIYEGSSENEYNPVVRSDLIRSVYKRRKPPVERFLEKWWEHAISKHPI